MVNFSQNRGAVGTLNDRKFKTQPKVSPFTNLSEKNGTLASGSLHFPNKITLVLLLPSIIFVFKGNVSKHTKAIIFSILFSTDLLYNLFIRIYIQLISLSGDVKINRRHRRKAT